MKTNKQPKDCARFTGIGGDVDLKDWDILDGRTKIGKPVKKIAKVLSAVLYTLAMASFSFILVTLAMYWIGVM